MNNSPALVNKASQALAQANTPAQTKQIESISRAAIAYAKEQKDYEMMVEATHLYIMARRKTTELIAPEIKHGGDKQGNNTVTLKDYGFTKMQWNRREMELSIPTESVDEYFDECISKGWNPSLYDLTRRNHAQGDKITHADWCNVSKEHIIEFDGEFETLNPYINAERGNRYAAAKIKEVETYRAELIAKVSGVKISRYPVSLYFYWYRQNKKTDPDNIEFAKKFILDGLVKAGVLSDDGWDEIKEIRSKFGLSDNPSVVLTIVEHG